MICLILVSYKIDLTVALVLIYGCLQSIHLKMFNHACLRERDKADVDERVIDASMNTSTDVIQFLSPMLF